MSEAHIKKLKDMKQSKIILIVIALLLGGIIYSQQDPQYTQYMYNQNILNPAYAGSGGDLSIGLLGRMQWVGIDGAPDTQTLNIHGKVNRGLGLGLSVIHDNIGPVDETNLYIDASYTIQAGSEGKLAFGLKGGMTFMNVGLLTKTDVIDLNDPAFSKDYNGSYPNIGAGVYYYTDRFYTGFAIPGLLESYKYDVDGLLFKDVSDKRHIFFTTGYVFDLNDNLKLKPSAMMKMVAGAPISFDINSTLFINDKFEVGLSWREGDSIDAILGMQVTPDLRVGYAYDYTLSNLSHYNSGSHEIMLIYDLNFSKTNIKSPRYF